MTDDIFRKQHRELTDIEKALIVEIKNRAGDLLDAIKLIDPGRERALAQTKVEEAVMWATKAVTGS